MECVCGYKLIKDIETLQLQFIPIRITGSNLIMDDKYDFKDVFACPKCGTLKIEV